MRFKVLDQDGQVVGSGTTVDQAIADAASKLRIPWSDCDGPEPARVVMNLIENGDYSLVLP
jgi:hypothetical protein